MVLSYDLTMYLILILNALYILIGVILFENEVAKNLCQQMHNIERPTMYDINNIIANNITPILLPKYNDKSQNASLIDDINDLCSHPGYKILDIKTLPQTSRRSVDYTSDNWSNLIKSLLRMQILGTWSEIGMSKMLTSSSSPNKASPQSKTISESYSTVDNSLNDRSNDLICTSLNASLTLRGENAYAAMNQYKDLLNTSYQHHINNTDNKSFRNQSLPIQRQILTNNDPNTLPPCIFDHSFNTSRVNSPVKLNYDENACNSYQRSASLLSNSQAILPILNYSLSKAVELFNQGAYSHQYHSYGVSQDEFLTAFENIGQIVENYKSLA